MKYLISICLLAFASNSYADEENGCRELPGFFPYKAGIEAQKVDKHEEAFDIFCNLAMQGDYRSQFQLAKYFDNGIENYIDVDPVFALLWADLSNYQVKSKKRTSYLENAKNNLNEEELREFIRVRSKFLARMPTGNRIDMQFEPLNLQELYKEYQKSREPVEYTGSRIKRDKPPLNISSVAL
ncbi:hypothetical protein [Thalassotalea sp. PS06]|uniref:hypothetical protein n=1 Tax=Thalassotalea sp. PS06 TaxID=2594005 RepID=UPI0011656D8D|nr:hypothetical protein [Thalassotalea sp. PS06]QDP02438.1 hypothetical protein FNC98_14430 [Thalassotalea sp. PS06]